MVKEIVIDIETTGLNALFGDRITAIGCMCEDSVFMISEENEKDILGAFYNWITGELQDDVVLIGHNLRKFDIPFLFTRFLANGMDSPDFLLEMKLVDTMEITDRWVSLNSMAKILNCPMKNGHGFMAIRMWEERDIQSLLCYLKQDLLTTQAVYRKLKEIGTIK